MASLGYRLSLHSFDGPWLSEAQIDNLTTALKWGTNLNMYCAHNDLELPDHKYDGSNGPLDAEGTVS